MCSALSVSADVCDVLVKQGTLNEKELSILESKGFNPVIVPEFNEKDVGSLAIHQLKEDRWGTEEFTEILEKNYAMTPEGKENLNLPDSPFITTNQLVKFADYSVMSMEGKEDLHVLSYVAYTPKSLEKMKQCKDARKKLNRRQERAFSGPLFPIFRDKEEGGAVYLKY